MTTTENETLDELQVCTHCAGTKRLNGESCSACGGTGKQASCQCSIDEDAVPVVVLLRVGPLLHRVDAATARELGRALEKAGDRALLLNEKHDDDGVEFIEVEDDGA